MNYSILKKIISEKKITLKELAKRIDLSEQGLHSTIRNKAMKIETLEKIVKILEIDISIFFKELTNNGIEKDYLKDNYNKRLEYLEKKVMEIEGILKKR